MSIFGYNEKRMSTAAIVGLVILGIILLIVILALCGVNILGFFGEVIGAIIEGIADSDGD